MDPKLWQELYNLLNNHIKDYDLGGATSEVVDLILENKEALIKLICKE